MARMFINKRRRRISDQQLRNDQQPDLLFTIQGFLEDVAAVAVSGEFDYAAPEMTVHW
jgi:hypothetical protein